MENPCGYRKSKEQNEIKTRRKRKFHLEISAFSDSNHCRKPLLAPSASRVPGVNRRRKKTGRREEGRRREEGVRVLQFQAWPTGGGEKRKKWKRRGREEEEKTRGRGCCWGVERKGKLRELRPREEEGRKGEEEEDCVRGGEEKERKKREDPDRGKEEKKGEKEIGCHVSLWGWLKEDNEIFS
jgi:hypothetical protein